MKQDLTMETVLSKVSEYDIFRWFMPSKDWKLNHATLSPFRDEQHPSFIIGNKLGYLSFIDFADTNLRGDCFEFVKTLYHLSSLGDALLLIDKEMGLGIVNQNTANIGEYKKIISEYKQPEVIKKDVIIQVITRKFTKEELEYWNQYHQSITDLHDNNIYSIKTLFLNKKRFPLGDQLRFGYFYDGHWKIYRPLGTKHEKWFPNNVPITAMDGKEDIKNCKTAFINKSKKDYMVIKKIFPCTCAVQNEGIACFSPENVEYIKANSDKQILSFDSDVTGVKNSQQITQLFDFGYCNVPKKYAPIKDWADLAKIHGMTMVEEYFKEKQLI